MIGLWKNKKSKTLYRVTSVGSIKIAGFWQADALVTYHQEGFPETVYHRFIEDFEQNFKRVRG